MTIIPPFPPPKILLGVLPVPVVSITFYGVCTHIREHQNSSIKDSPVFGHRFVLVNASCKERIDSFDFLRDNHVPVHKAWLVLGADQVIGGMPLNFVPFEDTYMLDLNTFPATLTIANPGNLPQDNIAQCLPSLSHWIPDIGPGLAVFSADPAEVSCYFDFQAGVLNGVSLDEGAGVGNLMVVTIGNPILTITPFDGSAPTNVHLQASPKTGAPAGIVVLNFPDDSEIDGPHDFLLHFLAADMHPSPEEASLILPGPACLHMEANPLRGYKLRHALTAGPACSNSGIP